MTNKTAEEYKDEVRKAIEEQDSDSYYSCKCGDYDEGCIRCFRKELLNKLGLGDDYSQQHCESMVRESHGTSLNSPADTHNEEVCEICNKTKKEHPTYTYYGNQEYGDVEECKKFKPKKKEGVK